MREKEWRTCAMSVNGLPQRVRYRTDTVEHLFLPLLRRLTELQRRSGRRCIVFLAAPPATGKTTLAQFLAQLSRTEAGLTPVQALGMDGFHYPNRCLAAHTIRQGGCANPPRRGQLAALGRGAVERPPSARRLCRPYRRTRRVSAGSSHRPQGARGTLRGGGDRLLRGERCPQRRTLCRTRRCGGRDLAYGGRRRLRAGINFHMKTPTAAGIAVGALSSVVLY